MPTPLRLLLVEDSADDAELILRELRRAGFDPASQRVDTEDDFIAALSPGIELIISDYAMPQFSGLRALELRNERHRDTPFIVVSGTIGEQTAVQAMQHGAADYLLKDRMARLGPAVVHALAEAREHRQRMAAEKELRDSDARFRQLAENSDDVYWFATINPERTTFISPGVEKISGRPASSYQENPSLWLTCIHPDDLPRVQAASDAIRAGTSLHYLEEYRVMRPDGAVRWVLDSATAIRTEGEAKISSVACVARDITERKNAEEMALRTQRLENLGMMAAGIAHDFNNTLTPMAMVGPILRPFVNDHDGLRMLDVLDQCTKRGAGLVQQLLSCARGDDNQSQAVRVELILAEIVGLTRSTFPKQIEVTSKISDGLWSVKGKPAQIHQILLNLCINARDAMPDGGNLTLRGENCTFDQDTAHLVAGARPGDFLKVEVGDTGTGIPAEVLKRIWEPFYTTKARGKGTGLGLATVRAIVHGHGGFVTIQTNPGSGTTFTVYLPAIGTASPPRQSDNKVSSQPQVGDGALILVADDDPAVCILATSLLVSRGYRVVTASNGGEALSLFTPLLSEAKLLLADMEMPLLNGAALATALGLLKPELPVIIMSGLHGYAASIDQKSNRTFLPKPFEAGELLALVHDRINAFASVPGKP